MERRHGIGIKHLELGTEITIAYRTITGDPCLPTLVFLHEGLGCMEMWRRFAEQLCQRSGCPGMLYDRQGYGQSSPLTARRSLDYMHAYALKELPAVLSRVIPRRPYLIVGHSEGGGIGLIHAAQKPTGLRGVITEAAHVFVEELTLRGIGRTVENFDAGRLDLLYAYHGDKTAALFRAWAGTWLADWFQSWNLTRLLPEIQCPLLAVQGLNDQYGSPRQVAAIADGISGPSEKALLAGCGHVPHHEQRKRVLALMAEFIGRAVPVAGRHD